MVLERLSATPVRAALTLVIAFTALRVAFAGLLGFGIDESYTLGQARYWALSYFDHPPLHIWIARLAMDLFGPVWLVRLPFVAMFALTSWLMFVLTRHLFGGWAGVWTVLTLNASPFFLAAPGTWVLPDGPLLLCLTAGAWALARLMIEPAEGNPPPVDPWRAWLAAGVAFGLAGLSKYSAVLVVGGLLPFMLLTANRRWLVHPAPYVAAALTLMLISPAIVWNLMNDWASFRFQGGRAGAAGLRPSAFGQMVLGQILWLGPWIAIPVAYATIAAIPRALKPSTLFLLCLGLPTVLVFTVQSLWSGAALPHWPMPGWLFLIPLLGRWLVEHPDRWPSPQAWGRASAALAVVLALGAGALARTGALTLVVPPRSDPTLDAYDWMPLRDELVRRGAGRMDGPMIAGLRWNETGKVDFVVGDLAPVVVLNADARGFRFRQNEQDYIGRSALIVVTAESYRRDQALVDARFDRVDPPETFAIGRLGRPEIHLVIARGHGFRPN